MPKILIHIALETYSSQTDYGIELQKCGLVNMFPLSNNTLHNYAIFMFSYFLAFQLMLIYK